MPIQNELQKLSVDSTIVELFTVDCTKIGGSIYHFTPHFQEGGSIAFGGTTYYSLPVISEGWESTTTGTQPQPTLSITNIDGVLLGEVVAHGDMVGAKVTRLRTLKKYLDGQIAADSNQFLRPDIYLVEQKIKHDKTIISWQLSSALDKFGIKLPRRQITKDNFPGVGRQRGSW